MVGGTASIDGVPLWHRCLKLRAERCEGMQPEKRLRSQRPNGATEAKGFCVLSIMVLTVNGWSQMKCASSVNIGFQDLVW